MSNILIINGGKPFAHSNGELNDTLTVLAEQVLSELGHSERGIGASRRAGEQAAAAAMLAFLRESAATSKARS